MTEADMKSTFSGKSFQGYYRTGATWAATYLTDGSLDYLHAGQPAKGDWKVHGPVFCVFYALEASLGGGYLNVIRRGSNCFEYYRLHPLFAFDEPGQPASRTWHSRGWRRNEPQTCDEKPTV